MESEKDLVGNPDAVSNIRRIKLHIPLDESNIERKYRLEREKIHNWNNDFWIKHNKQFLKEKGEYQDNLKKTGEEITADKMSVFYKSFLDRTWNIHFSYNVRWYKYNAYLVSLAVRVKLHKFFKYIKFKNI